MKVSTKKVEQLKDVSAAYKKLQQIIETYNQIIKTFEENSNTLDKINEFQKVQQEKVVKSLAEIETANKQNKTELAKLIEGKTDIIRKENKDFYKDLESTIKIKLDDNKSEIKKLIENERNQIKQIFEIEFMKNTKELRQVIENETNKQTQLLADNQKTIKISIWVIGGLTLIMSLLALIKLWM
ncbi:hypothetical protein D1Z98_12115 [Riemerella anatipestifer]|uniref:hypothetical protein n=1 Tax=Riemerella anatipestifer TaxID=34085 RepID=UPI00129EBAD9|nr:hypothetical protein [Riemerella anatipestifer]MRM86247.1 hypothetical protein [Riemerella anatipestifer]MRM95638.1 hypothetical protein [Riemerella anatipestifer]WPC10564.1 hypothetical protein LEQ05_11775 [Riemerella anatipestifer]WPC13794.1 hypothetical protein LEQ03_03895 [Riemerella anatipestifer]WPC14451.1 hypothetical protein LEQ04_07385 [Riemerella anatipestifer]